MFSRPSLYIQVYRQHYRRSLRGLRPVKKAPRTYEHPAGQITFHTNLARTRSFRRLSGPSTRENVGLQTNHHHCRELYKAIYANNLHVLSTGDQRYWPTDLNKIPDLLYICVVIGINIYYLKDDSCLY